MAQLMLHKNLLKGFGKLPVKVQKKVTELIERFQKDPGDSSLHVHSLKESMADPKVRGANLPDGYRAIIIAPDKGDTFLLVHIDTHDEAYAWAKNKRFEVHQKTGVFQVFDVEEVEAATLEQQHIPPMPEYPLARLSDDELFQAGVPKPLLPAVRAIDSDNRLDAISEYLPSDCRDILKGVAAGMTLDDALEEMLGLAPAAEAEETAPGDFTAIESKPNFDLVLVEGEEHLKEILQASLEEWRVFLHPYQKKMVEWKTKGPMCITGAAGTGKTVALMHRAVYLTKALPDKNHRILVTTFTTNLSVTIKHQIRTLAPAVAGSIEVTNLHELANTICIRAGWRGRIATDEDLRQCWNDVHEQFEKEELPFKGDDLENEFKLVIDPNGITTEDEYLTTIRSSRSRISRKQRKALWPVFVAFNRRLKARNLLTFEGAVNQARQAVEQGNFQTYSHVLVDEVQDFSLEALRLVKALSPVDNGTANPLCVVGDGHQRIYRAKVPLSRAGIEVRGRSRRLKVNYRTSEQIRQFAQAILEGIEIDDLDGGNASIVGDRSVFHGLEPLIDQCQDEKAEAEAVVSWIQMIREQHGLATHEICVTPAKPQIKDAILSAGMPVYHLQPRKEDPGSEEPGIRLGTMKRIKGLEFRAIAMACANPSDPMNNPASGTPLQRCERYVAATRAREFLFITLANAK